MRKTFRRNIVLWWLTVAFGVPALVAQEQGPGANRVNASGKVIDSVTGRPIPNLHLHLLCSIKTGPGGSYDAVANERGAFTFVDVPGGVCAVKIDGYRLSPEYLHHFNGTEKNEPWIIQLIPAVVISGTVVDEKGSPLWSAHVFLGTSSLMDGVRSQAFAVPANTNQQGHFRIDIPQESNGYQVNENRYRLCAEYSSPGAEPRTAYPLICFPGVSDRNKAEWMVLHPGESRDITFRLTPVPAGTISGEVANPGPTTRVSVSHTDRADFSDRGFSVRDPWFNQKTSKFELISMLPGKYRIRAESGTPSALLTAAIDVEVRSGEVTNVQLFLTPEPVLRGRLRTDDGSPLERGALRVLRLTDSGGYSGLGTVIPDDGSFQTSVRKLESYRLDFDIRGAWHVASATWNGIDALAEDIHVGAVDRLEPLDVVLSRSVGTVEGSVWPIGGSVWPEGGASLGWVLLLRRVGSRVRNVQQFVLGRTYTPIPVSFTWNNIPPGIYWVLAMSETEVPFLEMEFLTQYKEFIQEIEVREGSTSRVELKLLELR
jgi:hypothetical protein